MKRTVIALVVTALAAGSAGIASAKPGNGNGAVKSGLAAASGLAPLRCAAADPADAQKPTANGFVVLNAPGKPAKGNRAGATRKLVGEVALKGAAASTTYEVRLANDSSCGSPIGTLTTNAQGNGNLSFQDATKGAGTWHVVLLETVIAELAVERFASAPATVR